MNKILVAYAGKGGSTKEVAETVGEVLAGDGFAVDVLPAKEVRDLSPYRAAVVGSAVRMGRWLPEAAKFVRKNRQALAGIPTAFFQVSGFLKEDTPEQRRQASAYLDPLRAVVEPASVGLFAGKMDFKKLSGAARGIARMANTEEGDWRDWAAIRAWAGNLRKDLSLER